MSNISIKIQTKKLWGYVLLVASQIMLGLIITRESPCTHNNYLKLAGLVLIQTD
jgi:hypothetical protein